MYRYVLLILSFVFFVFPAYGHSDSSDYAHFKALFSDWTRAFNRKDLQLSCALFSKEVVADYRGVKQKNYAAICDGFNKIFQESNHRYEYRFKLHSVYRAGDLAAVRITWYLTVFKNGKIISTSQDEGIDIFKKNKFGKWQIVNYLSYSV